MAGFADLVAVRWRDPDAGIWEVRADVTHHVHSKLMAWLALDRALRISEFHRTRARRTRRWKAARAGLREEIISCGVDPERSTYLRSYGSADVDAALLILPQLEFEPATAPRVQGTLDAIIRDLDAGAPLLYRYPPGHDGLPGQEGAFLPCSFWLVRALADSDRVAEAITLFDDLVALASPVGLYGEEMDPLTRHHLGNYPQALTHAALVQAALALKAAESRSSAVDSTATRKGSCSGGPAIRGALRRVRRPGG
jgi:GH15 family glucan-1,4-alpha-glucosidase